MKASGCWRCQVCGILTEKNYSHRVEVVQEKSMCDMGIRVGRKRLVKSFETKMMLKQVLGIRHLQVFMFSLMGFSLAFVWSFFAMTPFLLLE